MDINYAAIGKRIHLWRKRRNLTQEQLALLVDREPAYLSRIEHGNQKPSLDTLLRISCALNLDINNLLSDAPQLQSLALYRELEDLLEGCSGYEVSVILQNAQALKNILKSTGRTSVELP